MAAETASFNLRMAVDGTVIVGMEPAKASRIEWGAVVNLDLGKVCGKVRFMMPFCFSSSPLSPQPPSPPRVYQVWPAKNVFFLDGRVICGPDPRGLILTATAILLSEWIFLARIVDPSSTMHPILISASSMILAATVTASLLLTATRDPGIIPRNPVSPSEDGITTARMAPDRFIIVNGIETRLEFCRICKIFRPPRSSHCAVCDNCVDKFDHHCLWISQCIGRRNYRFYLLLMCLALAFYSFIFTFSVIRIRAKIGATSAGLFSLLRTLPETFVLAAFSFMAICFLAFLLAFHAFLVAKNKTSNERHKGQYRSSPNPYDKGALKNIKECLFEKLPPQGVDFRAAAEPNLGLAARTATSFPSPSSDDAGQVLQLQDARS
ncbi:probable protein S-acyltransferase 7 [Phragmites australis]|uniref:probable protein S-acyltransferase 7 n=1 Tax=Phragmites australis TaxID=29695 RepID=UPI002D7847E6|nr:probable protein S-acyltransferase 7 [Phragmites australis]